MRNCIREGWIGVPEEVPAKLSFRDLATLRTVQSLLRAGLTFARVRKDLRAIKQNIANTNPVDLSGLLLEARSGRVWVRGSDNPHISQLELDLQLGDERANAKLVTLQPAPALPRKGDNGETQSAEDWLQAALALEDTDVSKAMVAYREALALRPELSEAWVNLGRLMAENGDPSGAKEAFTTAIRLDPSDATALYNMGVVAQDLGDETDAIELYEKALELDKTLAEAHYNLATLYDQSGDSRRAIRHINEYRRLTR